MESLTVRSRTQWCQTKPKDLRGKLFSSWGTKTVADITPSNMKREGLWVPTGVFNTWLVALKSLEKWSLTLLVACGLQTGSARCKVSRIWPSWDTFGNFLTFSEPHYPSGSHLIAARIKYGVLKIIGRGGSPWARSFDVWLADPKTDAAFWKSLGEESCSSPGTQEAERKGRSSGQ